MTATVIVGNPKPGSRTLQAAVLVAERLLDRSPDIVVDLAGFGAGLPTWGDAAVAEAVIDGWVGTARRFLDANV